MPTDLLLTMLTRRPGTFPGFRSPFFCEHPLDGVTRRTHENSFMSKSHSILLHRVLFLKMLGNDNKINEKKKYSIKNVYVSESYILSILINYHQGP